ncbi:MULTISPECIES: hypothetical protein [Pseudanabaena]|uniref:Uncharacterized protein n=1 Tax=Pseudanabaena catenata USMAC16 TaxID=1855837 RepID=A0A9X4RLL0_9CYAN|nr:MULTISPECIES: hypothetical protein [Pseudanabaena]MDG3495089.1 hypothetical protein [Pseudanabaena catenata USMAC16]
MNIPNLVDLAIAYIGLDLRDVPQGSISSLISCFRAGQLLVFELARCKNQEKF